MSKRKALPAKIEVRLTERAIRDLHQIEIYSTEQWGTQVASRYLSDIQAGLDLLRNSPNLLRDDPDISKAFALYRIRRHCLVCQRLAGIVGVLAVIHGAMDLPQRLWELQPILLEEAEILASELGRQHGFE